MRKILLIALGAGALGVAGWSGMWFVGRGEISERLDVEIARLAGQGIEISHGTREISGFPFRYTVTHRDVSIHEAQFDVLYRLPEITSEATAEDYDRLVTRFPEKFQIEVSVPAEAGGEVEHIQIDVEAKNLIVVADGLSERQRDISSTAETLLFAAGGEDQNFKLAVELTGFDYQGNMPDPKIGGTMVGATRLARLDYGFAGVTSQGMPYTSEGLIDNLVVTASVEMVDSAQLPMLGSGDFAMTYQTGASELAIRAVSGEDPQGGTLLITSGSNAGTANRSGQVVDVAASSRQSNIKLLPEPMPASGMGFGADFRVIETIYKAPAAPSADMAPFVLRFAMDEVVPDDALWGLLDPRGTLPRDPARLVADIEGTGRITKNLKEVRPGEAFPLEMGNIIVRALNLDVMGAKIVTTGEVEFLQPLNLPQGQATISMNGVTKLVQQMAESGLVGPEVSQAAAIMTAVYTKPGEAPGQRIAEISMTIDGVSVNGQQVTTGN